MCVIICKPSFKSMSNNFNIWSLRGSDSADYSCSCSIVCFFSCLATFQYLLENVIAGVHCKIMCLTYWSLHSLWGILPDGTIPSQLGLHVTQHKYVWKAVCCHTSQLLLLKKSISILFFYSAQHSNITLLVSFWSQSVMQKVTIFSELKYF